MSIDVTFDFRSDAGGHTRDVDWYSPTLRRYHQLLWSKPLPAGGRFDLMTPGRTAYLHHLPSSGVGEFFLSSDSMTQTFTNWTALQHIVEQLSPADLDEFQLAANTIGSRIVFPSNKIDGHRTINTDRGCNRSISDRFDLSLECIRRHYVGEWSPIAATLDRYGDFLRLFRDFDGYVEFFHLQDLVDNNGIRFFLPFDGFKTGAIPRGVESFQEYRRLAIEFARARNRRIAAVSV